MPAWAWMALGGMATAAVLVGMILVTHSIAKLAKAWGSPMAFENLRLTADNYALRADNTAMRIENMGLRERLAAKDPIGPPEQGPPDGEPI